MGRGATWQNETGTSNICSGNLNIQGNGPTRCRKIKDREVVGSVQEISGHFYDRIITYMYCLETSCLIPFV